MPMVVVGGGAARTEISLCLSARYRRADVALTLVSAGDELLGEHPEANRRRAAAILGGRGVQVRTRTNAVQVGAGHVRTDHGEEIECGVCLWATGPAPPPLARASGLSLDGQGYIRVAQTLLVEHWADVFAAGDCASIHDRPWVARAGVYAVRQGPVLATNLARWFRGEPLVPYEPQRGWLSLLNTGDGRAMLAYRGAALHGRPARWLKDRIDRRFMRRFQRLGDAGTG